MHLGSLILPNRPSAIDDYPIRHGCKREEITTRVQDILQKKSTELVSVSANTSIRQAAAIIAHKHVGMVLVLDARGELVGSLSERDIVRFVATRSQDITASPVKAAMADIAMVAHPNDPIIAVMQDMTEKCARHLPVVTEGKLIGVISIGDILKSRIVEKDQEPAVLRDIARLSLVAAA